MPPSPPPPSPAPPPVAPGSGYVGTLTVTTLVSGSVQSFDADAYAANMASILPGVGPRDITLNVTAGSVLVEHHSCQVKRDIRVFSRKHSFFILCPVSQRRSMSPLKESLLSRRDRRCCLFAGRRRTSPTSPSPTPPPSLHLPLLDIHPAYLQACPPVRLQVHSPRLLLLQAHRRLCRLQKLLFSVQYQYFRSQTTMLTLLGTELQVQVPFTLT